jgi:serine/threonine-protein kinase
MSARNIGHYELIDHYASGGVAEIYRARDVRSGEVVVIKRIKPGADFDPEAHAGFLRELQLALMCKHKNLIRGIEKGSQAGHDYGVLEFVDGQDLQHVLERAKRLAVELPISFATSIVAEILDGLDFAWRLKDATGKQLGLVHRDLAPKNVFIRYDGQIRVGDFGSSLATLAEPPADAVVGTLGYMSPEQARLEPLDQRSDIYAAGLILYELVTGERAFDVEGKKELVVLKAHQKAQMKPIPAHVPDDIRLIIEIACAPDREDRYASARDMRQGLARCETPPASEDLRALAALVRSLFVDELSASRIPGLQTAF